ncbi:RNA polymerase sigma factor [Candidatus Uhrbacteria bacterium]|jgi:RNA polymerase sigma-70 factor, ECF subfamily|nr:RNA polymerase sigma factor [Candidatus Uhrbacteria bacterium]
MNSRPKHIGFLQIYDEYYPKLYAYILARVRHRERAEDIVQQTFVKAMQHFHSYKAKRGATIGSWLFTIAKHTFLDEQKKIVKVSLVEDSALEHLAPSIDSALDILIELEDDAVIKEEIVRMWKTIDTLTKEEQEVIRLKYIAGLSYKDISALTGVKPNTLAQLLRRALKKCQKAL